MYVTPASTSTSYTTFLLPDPGLTSLPGQSLLFLSGRYPLSSAQDTGHRTSATTTHTAVAKTCHPSIIRDPIPHGSRNLMSSDV